MIDIILRYQPVLNELKKTNYRSLLEIGSDDYGISPYISDKKIILSDLAFRRKNLKNVEYLIASALKLPFKNSSIDIVVSIDVLEHIPPNKRLKAITEIYRVTKKKMILVFPADKAAEDRDRKVYRIMTPLKNNPCTKYIHEHINYGLPITEVIVKHLKNQTPKSIKIQKHMNAKIDIPLVILSNLNFIPILLLQKVLDRFSIDCLPFFFRLNHYIFGWLNPYLSFGKCYRSIIIVEKK